jgi:hypothetical protein
MPSKKVRELKIALARAYEDIEHWQAEAERRNVRFTLPSIGPRVEGELSEPFVGEWTPPKPEEEYEN